MHAQHAEACSCENDDPDRKICCVVLSEAAGSRASRWFFLVPNCFRSAQNAQAASLVEDNLLILKIFAATGNEASHYIRSEIHGAGVSQNYG
jgi:hypothetical protein